MTQGSLAGLCRALTGYGRLRGTFRPVTCSLTRRSPRKRRPPDEGSHCVLLDPNHSVRDGRFLSLAVIGDRLLGRGPAPRSRLNDHVG
jgi:hypothetical protein